MVVAFMRRGLWYVNNRNNGKYGNYNGYVAFKEELLLDLIDNRHECVILDNLINIHGGITYDCSLDYMNEKFIDDYKVIPLTDFPESFNGYRIIGFDTNHKGDTAEYWTFERTKEETLNLKKQIEKLISSYKK